MSIRSRCRQRIRERHNRNIPLFTSSGIGLSFELEHSRAAEFHSEVALMITKMNCCLNCLISRLSVRHGLVVRLVQVSDVSCVFHDAVSSVSGPRVLLIMKFLNVSSVPVFGLLSLPLRHSLSQQCARGSSLTCQTRFLSPAQYLLGGVLPDDNSRCSGVEILNKTISANGTISCV